MEGNTIFVHIPKTGGTTITSAITNNYWASEPNFNYRHIIEKTKKSNSGDIFDLSNINKYSDYNIFMMLRHPVDKVISEYYFFKEREVLMKFFRKKPLIFEEYIMNTQTQNATINFLKGRRLYDIIVPTKTDLKEIIDAIDSIPIHVGIFEDFEASMQFFSNVTNIKWKKEIPIKRMTFKRPDKEDVSEEIKKLILDNNKLDMELYNYCLDKFSKVKDDLKIKKIKFLKNKYNDVIPYVAKTCFFEFCMTNKKFIKQNFNYFKDLTFYLLKDKNIKDGFIFTQMWNETFVKSISYHFPNTAFSNMLENSFNVNSDPLDQTVGIAESLDKFFKENSLSSHKFYTPLTFKKSLVVDVESNKLTNNPSFFSKLFKK